MKKEKEISPSFKRINDHVVKKGIKYTWLCDKISISTGHLSNIKYGNKALTHDILDKINKALGTDFKL
jgi:DNA-binding Xre family transcriptional regulator